MCLSPLKKKQNMLILWYFSIFLITSVKHVASIRVCETFPDYLNSTNQHCTDNTDAESNVTQILVRWGCTVKEHYIITADGYKILVIQAFIDVQKSTPIIMAHGIMMNSLSFVGKYNKSSAYHFIMRGYQLFFVNCRGTRYCTKHVNYTDQDRRYWNFNLHEMAIYDLRSCVNLVFELTNQKSIIFAYSMGSSLSLIYASTFPTEAQERLKGLILMAPVRTFVTALAIPKVLAPFWPLVRPYIDNLWNGQFAPRSDELNNFCSRSPAGMYICETLKIPIIGEDYAQMDPLYLPVTDELYVDRTGIDVVGHYAQDMVSGIFRQFDYGLTRNLEVYGNMFPPAYKISEINVPTALFVGLNDWLASPGDATALSVLLGRFLCGLTFISYPKWNHVDFVTGKDMDTYLNGHLVAKIAEMEDGYCFSNELRK